MYSAISVSPALSPLDSSGLEELILTKIWVKAIGSFSVMRIGLWELGIKVFKCR
jgi:hypothetical protein